MNSWIIVIFLVLPMVAAIAIIGLKPQGVVEWINARAMAIDGYYERRRGTFGFFLKWTLRPGLWVYDKIFDKIEASAHEPEKKAALHLIAVSYVAEFVLFLMYAFVVVVVAIVLLLIVLWIVAKILGANTPNLAENAWTGGTRSNGGDPHLMKTVQAWQTANVTCSP